MDEIIGYFWSRSEAVEYTPCALRTIRNGPRPVSATANPKPDPDGGGTGRSEPDKPNPIEEGKIGWFDGIRYDTCGMRVGWPDVRPATFEDMWTSRRRRRADEHTAEAAAE